MGVKISKVKDSSSNKEITVRDCENGYEGEYICPTDGCRARMTFVRTYEQRRLEKIIVVPSYFKLKLSELHAIHCPFNTEGAVEIIARSSDNNVLKSIAKGKYEFSLQILHKSDSQGYFEVSSKDKNDSDIGGAQKSRQYAEKGTATSYINTLKQILVLRSAVEESKELGSIITLSYGGKKVAWKNFYFEETQYLEAFQIISGAKITNPVCFHGRVSSISQATEKFKYPKIKLHSPYIELVKEMTPIPSVELIIADNNFKIETVCIDQEVLVYGNAKTSPAYIWIPHNQRNLSNPKSIQFLNMNIWINHDAQVMPLKWAASH